MQKQIFLFIFLQTLIGISNATENLNLSAQTAIIQKLESVVNLANKDSMIQTTQIKHRLADLYAERARLLSLEDKGNGAIKYSKQIDLDRKKSILTLQKILTLLNQQDKGEALLQISYLYELLSENTEALKMLKSIEKNPTEYNQKTKALAEIKLGDYSFANNNLDESLKHFEKSMKYLENPRKTYCLYRIAWLYFDLGQTVIAENKLFSLLKFTKEFNNSKDNTDDGFTEEVTHDLATFMAHNDINSIRLKHFIKITPEKYKIKNLIYLAQELDRTAKKKSALLVWSIVGSQNLSFNDQVEKQIQITQIEYDLTQFNIILTEINKSIALLKKSECLQNPICTLAKQNLKKIIVDWGQSDKRNISLELISALKKYTESFEDYEISVWAANLTGQKRQYYEAFNFYQDASNMLKNINAKSSLQQKLFESSLVGEIAMSELTKDSQLKLIAYTRYLEFNPNGLQINEIRYKIAHWYYDHNKLDTARDEFKKIILDYSISSNLREKSADLCLDIDVLLKDESKIEKDSYELATIIKSKKFEYLSIYRKSILNQTAALLNSTSTEAQLKNELTKLNQVQNNIFKNNERILLIKYKMEISFRIKDLDLLTTFAKQFLYIKDLKSTDRQKAFHYLSWVAEIRMNFNEALKYMKLIQPQQKELVAYNFKYALLKELALENPTLNYEHFLTFSHNSYKNSFASHQIILYSPNPIKIFKKYQNILKKNKDLFVSAAMFTYEKTLDKKFAKYILAIPVFKKSLEANLIKFQIALPEFKVLAYKATHLNFKSISEIQIEKRLVQRNLMIHNLEKITNESIAQKDIIEQLIFLSELSTQNKRLSQDILALSKHMKLMPNDNIKYQDELLKIIQSYQNQALNINNKVKELWAETTTQNLVLQLNTWAAQVHRPGHTLALQELSLLKDSIRNQGLAIDVFENLSEKLQKMSSKTLSLQQQIYKTPFDSKYLEKLKTLQIDLGSGPMVAYLDSRIDELNSRRNSQ